MTEHRLATHAEWQVERDELLEEEKELPRACAALPAERRRMAWMPEVADVRFSGQTSPWSAASGTSPTSGSWRAFARPFLAEPQGAAFAESQLGIASREA